MTDDFDPGARWTIQLWPANAVVLFDWLMNVEFDQIPVRHKLKTRRSLTC